MKLFLRLLTTCILLVCALPAFPQSGLPEPRSVFVNDFADLLSPSAEAELANLMRAAKDARGVEMTVVVIDRVVDYQRFQTIEGFATELFNDWGVGDAARDDGIMLLVALADRKTRIELGRGYPERFDTIAQQIIDEAILPAMREFDFRRGIYNGTRASLARLDIDAAPEPDPRNWLSRRMDENVAVQILVILGGFVTLPLSPFMVLLGVKKYRKHRRRRCPECGRKMRQLGEVQEKQYLDAGQLLEEKIASSEYGVWFCEHDEHVTVQRFALANREHGACPDCRYHTMETRRNVKLAATYSSTGLVALHDTCAHCGRDSVREVVTPMLQLKRDDDGDYGTGRSYRSGGSSGSSGGFGGGSSSGGGASGSW